MKVLINHTGIYSSIGIALPIELSSEVAAIIAKGMLVQSDGYGESKRWSKVNDGIMLLSFLEDEAICDITPRENNLKKELQESQSTGWKKDAELAKLKKELDNTNAQLDLLKSMASRANATHQEATPMETAPSDDASSIYHEAYYAGMANGPVPGTD